MLLAKHLGLHLDKTKTSDYKQCTYDTMFEACSGRLEENPISYGH